MNNIDIKKLKFISCIEQMFVLCLARCGDVRVQYFEWYGWGDSKAL